MFWSLNLCRICSQIHDMCVPIFDQTAAPGIDVKIKRCISVIVTKDDMKPHQICHICLCKLNDFYNFISLFQDSNYKFENTLFQYSMQHPNGVLTTQDCVDFDVPLTHNPVTECSNLNSDMIPLHLDHSDVRALGDQHILNEIEQVDNILQTQSLIGNGQNCNKNCTISNNYYILEPTSQALCNRNKKPNLISVPSLISDFKVNDKECVPVEPSKNEKPKSITNILKPGVFTCAKCSKVFSRKQRLTEHLLKHTGSRQFICEQCGKSFAIKWDFTVHKRTHSSSLCCKFCSKCFSAPSKLQRHLRTHTNERPFICKIQNCAAAFSDKRNLVGHQVTHTNIRSFKCDICKRFYKTKSQLTDHLKAHNVTPSFSCKICGKCFKWKANLYMHNNNVHSARTFTKDTNQKNFAEG